MPIKLSASGIKDFLTCPAKLYFRINYPEEAIQTEEMQVGTIAHSVIEKHWDNKDEGILLAQSLLNEYNIKGINNAHLLHCLNNFYNKFTILCSPKDEVEKFFKVSINNVTIVGKIDRITYTGMVIDWKTAKTPPLSINNDIQFILYKNAYKNIYGKEPNAVYYASLTDGKMKILVSEKQKEEELFNSVIPFVINSIERSSFPKIGLYSYKNFACSHCIYSNICLEK